MMTCIRIRMRASFLSCLASIIFSQAIVDGSPIKVLANDPVGEPPELILIVIQIVIVVKQQLCKLRQDFPQRVFVLQFHKCPRAAAVLDRPASFPRYADGILLRGIKGKNLFQTNLVLLPVGQVIFVDPRFLPAEAEVTQTYLVRIVVEAHPSGSPNPIRFPANEKLMYMVIGPAERNL